MFVKKEITVVEPTCTKSEHLLFNAAFLKKLDKTNAINFIASERHINAIEKLIGKDYFQSAGKYNFPRHKFFSCLHGLMKLFLLHRSSEYLFLSVNTFHIAAITIINLFLRKKINIIPHAILESSKSKTSFFDKLLFFRRFSFWFTLYQLNSNNKFILLSSSIAKEYDNFKSENKNYSIVIHPYIYKDCFELRTLPETPIKIALIGVCDKDKGADWLVEQVETLNINNFEFYFLGEDKTHLNSRKINRPFSGFVPQKEYDEVLSDMDYFIFPFPESNYKLRASGTLFEALSQRKPIITSRNSFIINFLNEHSINYISFNRNDGLKKCLDNVLATTDEEYKSYQTSIELFIKEEQ